MVIQNPNVSPESLPWAKEITQAIRDLQRQADRATQDTINNNKQLNGSINVLTQTINAMPVSVADVDTVSPTSANTATWTTKATATVKAPEGKRNLTLSISGTLVLLDTVSGGFAAPPSARFLINGTTILPITQGVPAAKDSGASMVNNVVSLGSALNTSVVPGQVITVALQVSVVHSTAYATPSVGNLATVAVQGTFY